MFLQIVSVYWHWLVEIGEQQALDQRDFPICLFYPRQILRKQWLTILLLKKYSKGRPSKYIQKRT